jgi:hypothetical protein
VSDRTAGPAPALACRLYSEDRADAEQGFAVLEHVVRGMLRLVEARVKTNHIAFKPVGRGIPGSYWKAARSKEIGARQKRTTLLQDIATELLRGHIVFFHVDGDCTWAESRRASVWDELKRFRRDLCAVSARAQSGHLDEKVLGDTFLAVIPFYSIESWTYASTEHLRLLARDPKELERIAEWAADLGQLDEIPHIKKSLPSIEDRANLELARHIPAAELCAIDKSYADTVKRVRGSACIRAGLDETLRRAW